MSGFFVECESSEGGGTTVELADVVQGLGSGGAWVGGEEPVRAGGSGESGGMMGKSVLWGIWGMEWGGRGGVRVMGGVVGCCGVWWGVAGGWEGGLCDY